MGLIAGLVIGLWCQRLATALVWCLGVAAIASGAFAFGAMTMGGVPARVELVVLPALFAIALVPLVVGAGATVAVKRLLRHGRRPGSAAPPVRLGAPPPPTVGG